MDRFNVAYCGLYCGECASFKKGKCPGCEGNEKASWCEIRKCCREHGYTTCADCRILSIKECKKYNNIFARAIGFLTRTDRSKCVDRIREVGMARFAEEMTVAKRMSMKK